MGLRLECFATETAPAAPPLAEGISAEDRLAIYDQGYGAGWEDAIAARDDDAARLHLAVGQSLQALGQSWDEARQEVLLALRLLVQDLAARLLPALAAEALPALVADAILPLAAESLPTMLTVRLHPDARPAAEAFLARTLPVPIQIADDAGLTPGQAIIAAGPSGARVDLDAALDQIRAALAAFFDLLPPSPPANQTEDMSDAGR